jgi:gamma-glutamyltranspeptidase
MTATVNLAFGSRVLDKDTGIILNSQQDDFSIPGIANAYGYTPSPSNFVVGGKRPLSSTVPSIIEDSEGNVKMIVGAAGGPTIISGALNVIYIFIHQSLYYIY